MLLARSVVGLAGLCVAGALQAAGLALPAEGGLVGETVDVTATHDDTIIDLARRYGLGYEEVVNANPGVDPWLPGEGRRVLLPVDFSGQGIWNQFTLRVPGGRRDALKAFLTARKIGCEIYYPIPLHRQECFVGQSYRGHDSVPVSEQLSAEVLSIPIFPELTAEQRQWVADSLADFAAGKPE